MNPDQATHTATYAFTQGYEAAIDEVQRWCAIHYPGSFVERTIFGPLVRHLRRRAAEEGMVKP